MRSVLLCLAFQGRTDRLSGNVGNQLLNYAAYYPRIAKILFINMFARIHVCYVSVRDEFTEYGEFIDLLSNCKLLNIDAP
jgi:hypothetical protein